MYIDDQQFKDFIASTGLVSRQTLDRLTQEAKDSKRDLVQQLVISGTLQTDDIRRLQGLMLGIDFVDLKNLKIPFETLTAIPEAISREHNVIAFRQKDGMLDVALLDLEDLKTIEFLKEQKSIKIRAHFTDHASMRSAILHYQKGLKMHIGDLIGHKITALTTQLGIDPSRGPESIPQQLLELIVHHGVLALADDIHLEPDADDLKIRHRIAGMLKTAMVLPKMVTEQVTKQIKKLAGLSSEEKNKLQHGRFEMNLDKKLQIRVSIMPTVHGEKIVLHILPQEKAGFIFENLGFQGSTIDRLHEILQKPRGLILVTGTEKSGITSTLYTLLEHVNKPHLSLSSIEDPIEYHVPHVNQSAVNPALGLTFAQGLRSLMHQDSDVVMVGNLADPETAQLAFNVASRGRLVIAGIQADDATGAVRKLIDLGVLPHVIASYCRAIINQRLIASLGASREKYVLSTAELRALSDMVDLEKVLTDLKTQNRLSKKITLDTLPFYRSSQKASKEKNADVIGLQEVVVVSDLIRDVIMSQERETSLEEYAQKEGMMSMLEDGFAKAMVGQVSLQEVLKNVG